MIKAFYFGAGALVLSLLSGPSQASEVRVLVDHVDNLEASDIFLFPRVPSPRRHDLGSKAVFTLVEGRRDPNGGDLKALNDGLLPGSEDEPSANFFFAAGTKGGRISADLGDIVDIAAVGSYSWHPGGRGPQVYTLYAAGGTEPGFEPAPRAGRAPQTVGWSLLASVDTTGASRRFGGQYAVCITNTAGSLGRFRYLLWDISTTSDKDPFGNTFFSEIDIVGQKPAPEPEQVLDRAQLEAQRKKFLVEGGYEVLLDTTAAPDLTEWADRELKPMVAEWYPRIVRMLPSEGFSAPERISITIRPMNGVAFTSGSRIVCSAQWMRRELKREAVGAVFHELVHVVQQYGSRAGRGANVGWLVEGIPDYLRWYIYEPQSRGAEIAAAKVAQASYDSSYRVSANFLNWVVENHDRDIIRKLNTALRQGAYKPELWTEWTGSTVDELGKLWKTSLAEGTPAAVSK
jgi:hypothetical protein